MVRSNASLKAVCSDQISKLQVRHQHDLELLDDVRTFSKQRAAIEASYAQALLKLAQQHLSKKDASQPQSADSEESKDVKSPPKVWRNFVEETERIAKCHQQIADIYLQQVYEPAQILRKSKAQVLKKVVDQLSVVQKEALQSSNELTECHKIYVKEEQAAADARQKATDLEDKVKKKSTGLFQSFSSLQKKSEKTSTLRDQCDQKSTAARNAYIIQLALINAQVTKYFEQDLPSLIRQLDSNVTGQIQQFMATICRAELDTCQVALRGFGSVQSDVELLSSQKTMQSFFNDYPVFKDVVQFSFEPIEGDTVDHVSTQHGGDEMIAAETRKWANFLGQEAKNINGLKQELVNIRRTLVNASRLASPGEGPSADSAKSTIAIVDDCDARLDDLRMAIRRSRTSKLKAEAVMELFRGAGIDVSHHVDTSADSEDEEEDDETICADIRQLQHQLRVGCVQPNLLGTLSPNPSSAGRISALSVQIGGPTGGTSSGSVSPVSSVVSPNNQKKDPLTQQQKPERMTSVPASMASVTPTAAEMTPKVVSSSTPRFEFTAPSKSDEDVGRTTTQSFDFQAQMEDEEDARLQQELQDETAAPAEKWSSGMRFPLYAVSLYDYQAGNFDELSVFAGDRVEVVGDGDSEGWLSARSQTGQSGFIPQAYLATFQTEGELSVYIANMERENREAAALAMQQDQQVQDYDADQEAPQDNYYEQQPETQPQNEIYAAVPSFELTQASPTTEIADTEMKRIAAQPAPIQTSGGENGGAMPVDGEIFAQAVYDFDGVDDDELSFLEGDVIRVVAREANGVDDGYWYGELNGGRRGWFPSLVVEVLDSPNSVVPLPGELKSPESGPPGFIPPPPVVLIEATPLPTPLDSPTGTHGYKRSNRNNQSGSQDEDADSGFGGTSQVTRQDPAGEDEEERQVEVNQDEAAGQSEVPAVPSKQVDVVALLRKRAAEITELVLTEARDAIEKGELVVEESLEDDEEEVKAEEVVSSVIGSAAAVVTTSSSNFEPKQRQRMQSASGVSISSEGGVSLGEEDFHSAIAVLVPKADAKEMCEEAKEEEEDEDDEMSLR